MTKKRNLLFLSLFILVVLLVTSCLPKPPLTEGILKGQVIVPEGSIKVKDLTGQALSDATVNIIDLLTGDIIATTTTDSNGYYQVFVPAGGPYLLEAIKDGIKIQEITPQVEVGIEYEMGTADCSTTAVALIAQGMMDAEDNPADIDFAAIIAYPNFDDVSSIVCSTIQAGQDPAVSAVIEQAIEDFLYPPEPEPAPTVTVINIAAISGVTVPVTGATPVTMITETAQYTGTVTWATTNNPFAGRTAYTATINLTPKAGFNLTGVAANFFTVAGTSSPVTNAINSGVVTAEFPATADVAVGDSCGGGKVAYILLSGDPGYDTNIQHGLIATTSDQVGRWSDVLYNSVGTTEYEIGTGQANTTAIVGQAYCTNGAAYDCDKLTEGGYNDWFLPSLYELQKLFDSKDAVGGFGAFPYWSSSESGAENAWYHDFNDDESKILAKGNSFSFRAVRDF